MRDTLCALVLFCIASGLTAGESKPNIIFVMADDMGWGETSYRNHPVLKTPHLDEMAAAGLRFDRFYAGCPVCSPTRASVLTGRANDRTGVLSHGYALRLQEKTIAKALGDAGYVCGHFGKWHLNGFMGPGVPILATDPRSPGAFGFDDWVSVTNFFDVNPILSRRGKFEEFTGDSSEIAVAEALRFLEAHHRSGKPMFAVIWFGTPHVPFRALPEDKQVFDQLDDASANHYGELVAMDRSMGTLRRGLRQLGIAEDTLLVFCSDNGGLNNVKPDTVGGLRGNKASVYEGGLRVPGIIEWPSVIKTPRTTDYPASTMDLFPTVQDIVGLPSDVLLQPIDGASLKSLLDGSEELPQRNIPFRFHHQRALIGARYKLVARDFRKQNFELFDLQKDPKESRDISGEEPAVAKQMIQELLAWNDSVDASFRGADYPEGEVVPPDPVPIRWSEFAGYKPYRQEWKKRPEYRSELTKDKKRTKSKN